MTASPHVRSASFADLDGAIAVVRASGCRVTLARKELLRALFELDEVASAERLARAMGDDGEPADLPSVYRNLEVLEGLGIVRHLHAGHGPGLYALAGEDAREYLVCESCGEVRSVPAADLDRLREEIRHQFGFEVRFSHFPITGLCARCADQTESAGP